MARVHKLDNPDRAKTEEEVYHKVMEWLKEHDEVARIDPDLGMSDRYKMFAVRKIITGKVKEIIGNRLTWKWTDMLKTILDWSLKGWVR